MSKHLTAAITVLKSATLLLGGLITYYAAKAYRTTGSRALRALAAGFAVVTAGALLAGVLDRLVPVTPALAFVVESAFTTAGFAVILYSLYVE
jgi:CHASE2 domain-containing sensor protein